MYVLFQYFKGRVIFSSGSPFPPVTIGDKTFSPGQGNNAYIFPGVALGVIATGTHHIPDDMFLIAAQELANYVEQVDLDRGSLYPPLSSIREISMRIAIGVTKCAYDKGKQNGNGNLELINIQYFVCLFCFLLKDLPQLIPNLRTNVHGWKIKCTTLTMSALCQ